MRAAAAEMAVVVAVAVWVTGVGVLAPVASAAMVATRAV